MRQKINKKQGWLSRWDEIRLKRGHAEPKFRSSRTASISNSFWKIPVLKGLWKRNSQLSWLGVLDGGGLIENN